MSTAPDRVCLARKMGSSEWEVLPLGVTMSWGYLDGTVYIRSEHVEELVAENSRLKRTISQMREDFHRIEMMAEQHCPVMDLSVKVGGE